MTDLDPVDLEDVIFFSWLHCYATHIEPVSIHPNEGITATLRRGDTRYTKLYPRTESTYCFFKL